MPLMLAKKDLTAQIVIVTVESLFLNPFEGGPMSFTTTGLVKVSLF